MKVIVIPSRSGRWHLPLLEQPGDTAKVLLSSRESLVTMARNGVQSGSSDDVS